jgi:hypothetical protein
MSSCLACWSKENFLHKGVMVSRLVGHEAPKTMCPNYCIASDISVSAAIFQFQLKFAQSYCVCLQYIQLVHQAFYRALVCIQNICSILLLHISMSFEEFDMVAKVESTTFF